MQSSLLVCGPLMRRSIWRTCFYPRGLSVLREALELPGESAAPARVVLVLLVALRVVLFWLEAGGFFREAGCRTRRAVELAPSGESCYLPRAR